MPVHLSLYLNTKNPFILFLTTFPVTKYKYHVASHS